MGWANTFIERLKAGETIQCRPRGNSMVPLIRSGQLCTIAPITHTEIQVDDIVLCRVRGSEYLHRVTAIREFPKVKEDEPARRMFLIANNRGHENGWTSSVYGRLVSVED